MKKTPASLRSDTAPAAISETAGRNATKSPAELSEIPSERLEALGITVLETPLGEFLKAGGSAKCLVLIIG